MNLLVLIILVVILFAVLPRWNYSRKWGYNPSRIIGVILVILLILALLGKFPLYTIEVDDDSIKIEKQD